MKYEIIKEYNDRQHHIVAKTKRKLYNRDMDRQMRLAEINDEFGAARTNKREFLEKMDEIIPWKIFVALIQSCYYKGERGNKPYPLELMLRIFILQNLYDLADMKVKYICFFSLYKRYHCALCCIHLFDSSV